MSIVNTAFPVESNELVAQDTWVLRFRSPELATMLLPGQFLNILTDDGVDPLLRRPYSISNIYGDLCEILFTVVGKGSGLLSRKRPGDHIGVLGPLGNTFGYTKDFATALIVAGGIGVAPFPLLTTELLQRGRPVLTFLGARNASKVVTRGLVNVHIATDDGSTGYHGTITECLGDFLAGNVIDDAMIFACGPTPMLNSVRDFALDHELRCELSLESEMACGIGICQGCPIERCNCEEAYALVCTEGPCFDARDIKFHEHQLR